MQFDEDVRFIKRERARASERTKESTMQKDRTVSCKKGKVGLVEWTLQRDIPFKRVVCQWYLH